MSLLWWTKMGKKFLSGMLGGYFVTLSFSGHLETICLVLLLGILKINAQG